MSKCLWCETTELSGEDEAVNKYAMKTLKIPCITCRREIIREYSKTIGKRIDFPSGSHEEYLSVPYSYRKLPLSFTRLEH